MGLASKDFAILSKLGHAVVEKARQAGWSPSFEKKLGGFGITEAAKMCQRSTEAIRKLEDSGKLPPPKFVESSNGRRSKRFYTLDHINLMRDHFKTRPSRNNKPPMVIMVANFKGGVTKSHTTVHLAQYLGLKGYKILVCDLDSQATSTTLLGFSPNHDISENDTMLSFFRKPIPNLVENPRSFYTNDLYALIKPTYFAGIDIIPSNLSIFNVEFEIPFLSATAQHRNIDFQMENIINDGLFGNNEKKIKGIADNYDIIILDCSPSLGILSMNAAYTAQGMIIPVPPNMVDISSTAEFFSMLNDLFTVYPDKEFAFERLLITKHQKNKKKTHNYLLADSMKHVFLGWILKSTMISSDAIEKVSTEIKTIYDVKPSEFDGDRKTLKRAIDAANEVNTEIEGLIKDFWNSH